MLPDCGDRLIVVNVDLSALTLRLVHATAPVLLTKIGPLGTLIRNLLASLFKQARDLTQLKFENRLNNISKRFSQFLYS